MIAWQSACSVLEWWGERDFGVYPPAADAFSDCTRWCAYSAACAGITRRTEPAITPMVSDFRMSRRVTDLEDTDLPETDLPETDLLDTDLLDTDLSDTDLLYI